MATNTTTSNYFYRMDRLVMHVLVLGVHVLRPAFRIFVPSTTIDSVANAGMVALNSEVRTKGTCRPTTWQRAWQPGWLFVSCSRMVEHFSKMDLDDRAMAIV